ncbi:MAG: hypothetical protein ABIH50_02380 [bacterium]
MKLINIQNILKEKKMKIFTTRELRLLLKTSEDAVRRLLWRYEKKGIIVKLKRGMYALKSNYPSLFQVANKLYSPSYISFDAAMSFHHIIPETIYAVTCATTGITREFIANGVSYSYHRIKPRAFTGYKPIKYDNQIILMAEPEKAIADYLYYVDIGKRGLHYERMDLKNIKKNRLREYIKMFQRPGMMSLVDNIYDEFRRPQRIY